MFSINLREEVIKMRCCPVCGNRLLDQWGDSWECPECWEHSIDPLGVRTYYVYGENEFTELFLSDPETVSHIY